MKRSFIIAGLVLLTALGAVSVRAAEPRTLRIEGVRSLNDIYAEVSLEFPKAWENPDFEVQVNGGDVNASVTSGGYSDDRRTASLLFFPGKPGVKKVSVSVIVGGKTIRASESFDWNGCAFAAILGYPGDRLLVTSNEKVRVVTANMDDVTIRINGGRTSPEVLGRDATLFSFVPAWRPGLNTVSVDGNGADRKPVSWAYTFVYAREGMRQGETALLDFGAVETKSGLFYSVSVEGDAIVADASRMADSYVLDKEGWLGRETRLVRELRAVKRDRRRYSSSRSPISSRKRA